MKSPLYFLLLSLMLSSCSVKEKTYSGFIFDTENYKIDSVLAKIKGDSLIIIKRDDPSQERLLAGTVNDSGYLKGVGPRGISLNVQVSNQNDELRFDANEFYFTATTDSPDRYAAIRKSLFDRRKSQFDNLGVNEQAKILEMAFSTYRPTISLDRNIDQSFSVIPENTSYSVITDFSSLTPDVINDSEVKDASVTSYWYESFYLPIVQKIKGKTPLVCRSSSREFKYTGNRFADGGLSRSVIGDAYDMGNYITTATRGEVEFIFFDKNTFTFVPSGFGYVKYSSDQENNAFEFSSQSKVSTTPWVKFFQFIDSTIETMSWSDYK
jgi:hypothetical protein